jgi:hypothetical protein
MTGPEHYQEAERLLKDAESSGSEWPRGLAQVHAILALAATTAVTSPTEARAWADVAGTKLSGA